MTMKTTPEDRANLRADLERCATRLITSASCSVRELSELLDDFATLEAELAALRRVERGDMHAECNHNRERGHRWKVVDEVNERIGWGSSLLLAVADADSKEQR